MAGLKTKHNIEWLLKIPPMHMVGEIINERHN